MSKRDDCGWVPARLKPEKFDRTEEAYQTFRRECELRERQRRFKAIYGDILATPETFETTA